MAMKSFKRFLEEFVALAEAANKDDASHPGGISSNTKGVLHELLVGKHLNGGNHMEAHHSEGGETPEQAHDRLRSQIHPADYEKANERAKSAAEDIRKQVERNGHKVHKVSWTSKPGDTEKVTGHKATQSEDSSDLYVSTRNHNGSPLRHHGVSLKVTDSSNKNIGASNLGMESMGSKANQIHADHKKAIVAAHPELGKLSNKEKRAGYLKANPKVKDHIADMNKATIRKTSEAHAEELHQKLNSSNPEDHAHVMNTLRATLAAHSTPAERDGGHGHIRHTTYTTKKGTQHDTVVPGSHYENYLNDHRKISVKASGGSVHFYHDGKKIASIAHKFKSQSDPLGTMSTSGKATV